MAERRNATETYVQNQLGLYVPKSLFDANTILKADTDDTPVALSVPASTFVGRKASGSIAALSVTEAGALVPPRATSMPGSPATNDIVFRTDLGILFYYDGTRWLTVNRYIFNYPLVAGASGNNYNSQIQSYPVLDMWLEAVYYTAYVSTLNNGSNYWNIQPYKSDVAAGATSLASAITTSAGAVATRLQFSITLGAALGSGATWPVIYNAATKTGAPGTLDYNALLAFRLIGT